MNKLEELSNRIRVPMGREDRSGVGFWVVTPSKGRVIELLAEVRTCNLPITPRRLDIENILITKI